MSASPMNRLPRGSWPKSWAFVRCRLLFTFVNHSGLSPHWLGVHEAVVPDAVVPDPHEVAWHGWLTEPELCSALLEWRFTPDSHEAFSRYLAFRTTQS